MTTKNSPRSGKVKNPFLGFVCKVFGRTKIFRFEDAVKAGWGGSKNVNLAKLARNGYLKSVGKKRYRYLRGVKAPNGQVVPRPRSKAPKAKEVTPRVPLTPAALMADHAAQNGLVTYSKAEVLAKLERIRVEAKRLQEDETKLIDFLEALEKLPDVKEILSK